MAGALARTISIASLAAALALSPMALCAAEADEDLRFAAVEALAASSPERAVPLIGRVLDGDASLELKTRALFVLGQFGGEEAHALLFRTLEGDSDVLRVEALRAIGIAGEEAALAQLQERFADFDEPARMATLEAFLIAGHVEGVAAIARDTDDEAAFEQAVDVLAAMGAVQELRNLGSRTDRPGASASLIEAFMVAGDAESLQAMIRDEADAEVRAEAIRALGLIGGEGVGAVLVGLYREETDAEVRAAARDALFVSGHDEALLELYRSSDDAEDKRELLETLILMDSPGGWALVEEMLQDGD